MPYAAAKLLGQSASIAGNASNAAMQPCTAIAALVDRARQDDPTLRILQECGQLARDGFVPQIHSTPRFEASQHQQIATDALN